MWLVPDSRSGLITGDFVNRKVSQTTFVSRDENHKEGHFFRDPFPVRTPFAFVSLRQACYRLVQAFSIPVDSPWDQRGKSRCRNRVLRFEIRVESGRISPRFFRYCWILDHLDQGVARSRFESSMFWKSWLEYPVVSSRSFGRSLYSGFSNLPEKYCLLWVCFSWNTSGLFSRSLPSEFSWRPLTPALSWLGFHRSCLT